jgi:tetratricopeptide (TPR) repeat protein
VRVRRQEGGSGSGVLVAPGWVLTCAHVVRSDSDVLVGLHPEARSGGSYAEADRSVTGTVTHSSPTRSDHSPSAFWPFPDLALVRIPHEDHIFAPLSEVPFGSVSDGIHAWGFGLREDDRTSPGVPGQYQWAGQDGDGMLQLQAGHAPRGISGAPIVSTTGGVFGLISVSRDPNDAHGGWASPVIALSSLAPRVDDAPPAEEVWRANQENAWKHREAWARATLAGADNPLDQPWETAQSEPAPDAPSTLLLPQYRIVPLVGRDEAMAVLRAWCGTPAAMSIRAIQDLGGTGKTRLAVEVGREMAQAGWVTGFFLGDKPEVPRRSARLVLVDYASGHDPTELKKAMEALLQSATSMEPVRILLLDRNERRAKTLAESLKTSGSSSLKAIYAQVGEPLDATADLALTERAELFRQSVAAFSGGAESAVEPPDLSNRRYRRALDVVIAAYDACLVGDSFAVDAFERAIDHEVTHWRGRALRRGVGPDSVLSLVALATLCGARDEGEAGRLLDLLKVAPEQRVSYDALMRGMYPGSWLWNPLRPDRLGEALVSRWLRDEPVGALPIIGALLDSVTNVQLARAFAVAAKLTEPEAAPFAALFLGHGPALLARLGIGAEKSPEDADSPDQPGEADPPAIPGSGELLAAIGQFVPALVSALDARDPIQVRESGAFDALDHVAQRLRDFGFGEPARVAARYAIRVCTALAEREPGNTGYQRDLSVSYNKLADLALAEGDPDTARRFYTDGLDIRRGLAEREPGNTGHQRDLSVSYERLADLALAEGDPDTARRFYTDGLDIRRGLAEREPGNTGYQRDLSVSYERLADLALAEGDPDTARRFYTDGLDIRRGLAEREPGNTGYQRDLSVSYERLADLALAEGDPDTARRFYTDGLDIARGLAEREPGNTGYQRDLSVSYNKLADLALAEGDPDTARRFYTDGLDIRRGLAEREPGNTGHQRDLSVSYNKLADLALAEGDPDTARRFYTDGLDIRRGLAEREPGNTGHQRDLSVSYERLADLALAEGDPDTARRFYTDGLDIARGLAEREPGNTGHQRDLSVSYNKLADLALAEGDPDTARRFYTDGLDIARGLAEREPGNTGHQRDLSVSYERLADLALRADDGATAAQDVQEALTRRFSLVGREPSREDLRVELAYTLFLASFLGFTFGDDARSAKQVVVELLVPFDDAGRLGPRGRQILAWARGD